MGYTDAFHAECWNSTGIHDLNQEIDPESGANLNQAIGINQSGEIICNGILKRTMLYAKDHAFLLVPVDVSLHNASQ